MTKDDIIALPNPHLRTKSQRVGLITPEIKQIVADMEAATINWDESRDHEVGVALAAVQIDQLYKIIVVRNNYDDKTDHTFTAFINPEITKLEGDLLEDFEGCLSVPNVYGKVPRRAKAKIKATNILGREFRVTAEGFLARIFQHEIDHCNGLVFIDHIKDNPSAFYELKADGNLEQLEYSDVKQIVFFGSGPVAAKALTLLAKDFEIEAVVTKPQPPHHKTVFPVLAVCGELAIGNILIVSNQQTLGDSFAGTAFTSRVGVVIDFGIIIPQTVIDSFPLGIVNSHFSLLPEWRGADPITFAVLSGQRQTGISLMLINDKMDEGPLLSQAVYDLPPTITTPELTNDLIELSNKALQTVLPLYLDDKIQLVSQDTGTMAPSKLPSYSRKLRKQDGVIDWQKSAAVIEREIRAYIEWPKCRTTIANKDVVITAGHVAEGSGIPGTVLRDNKQLGLVTGDGILVIDRLIPAGKKEMTGEAFLAGH